MNHRRFQYHSITVLAIATLALTSIFLIRVVDAPGAFSFALPVVSFVFVFSYGTKQWRKWWRK